MRKFIFIFVALLLSGCANIPKPGQLFVEPSVSEKELATVHFYRPKTFYMSVVETNIFVDDTPKVVLSSGTYATVHITPGNHTFKAKQKPSKSGGYSAVLGDKAWAFSHRLKAGQTYYITWYPSGIFSNKYKDQFIASNTFNGANPAIGVVANVGAEFGLVKPEFAKQEILSTKESKSAVELDRI